MTAYFVRKYRMSGNPKTVAMTYDKDEALAICSHPKTRGATWFYGWTELEPRDANRNTLPRVADLLHELSK